MLWWRAQRSLRLLNLWGRESLIEPGFNAARICPRTCVFGDWRWIDSPEYWIEHIDDLIEDLSQAIENGLHKKKSRKRLDCTVWIEVILSEKTKETDLSLGEKAGAAMREFGFVYHNGYGYFCVVCAWMTVNRQYPKAAKKGHLVYVLELAPNGLACFKSNLKWQKFTSATFTHLRKFWNRPLKDMIVQLECIQTALPKK